MRHPAVPASPESASRALGRRPVYFVLIAAFVLATIGLSPFVRVAHAAGALLSQGKPTTASS
ncbi:MAG: hypothetical protein QOI42_1485, partial [Frankiaceae bacterium]|nr:hypothetical protein [Frankiaceae bacterium]